MSHDQKIMKWLGSSVYLQGYYVNRLGTLR